MLTWIVDLSHNELPLDDGLRESTWVRMMLEVQWRGQPGITGILVKSHPVSHRLSSDARSL